MIKEFADVWMLHLLHAFDFSLDCLLLIMIIQFEFWIYLDCNSLFRLLVLCQLHNSVCSFAQDAYYLIFGEFLVGEGFHFLLGELWVLSVAGFVGLWLILLRFHRFLFFAIAKINSIVLELIERYRISTIVL